MIFSCPCDGSSRPKPIDPYGYHFVGCKIGANAIRLHDEVVAIVAKLFRTLRLDAIVEPMRLFANAGEDASNQRPDIFIRNPRGLGRQVIIDVAVTGVDGQSRTSDEDRGAVNRVKGSGRPRITTASEDERIMLSVKRDRNITSKEICKKLVHLQVSDKTIRRRIGEMPPSVTAFTSTPPSISKGMRPTLLN